jgi:hypothetical protein
MGRERKAKVKAFVPVHHVVGKEQRMEVRFVGGELGGGALGQRVVGLQFLEDVLHGGPIVVEAIDGKGMNALVQRRPVCSPRVFDRPLVWGAPSSGEVLRTTTKR